MKKIIINLVKFYKKNVSIYFSGCCRFHPGCSEYFIKAVERFGVLKGGFYGFRRILRCNYFFKGGVDFVEDIEIKNKLKIKKEGTN